MGVKKLASVLGKVISGKILCSQTIGLLHDLLNLLASSTANNKWDSFVSADPSLMDAVFTWINFVQKQPRRLWFSPQKTIYFSSDATLQAASAIFWGFSPEFHPNSCHHNAMFKAYTLNIPNSQNIAAIEGYAIYWGFQVLREKVISWLKSQNLSPQEVNWVWATDNQVCEAAFGKGRSREPLVHSFSQQVLQQVILELGIHITFPYIPSKINFEADSLSRLPLHHNWHFSHRYFSLFHKFCLKHNLPAVTCDALALRNNTLLAHYHSEFLDLHSLGDFFTASTFHHTYWVNPPADLMEKTLSFILNQGITAWVLIPVWPAAPWWHLTKFSHFQFDVKFQPGLGPICLSPNSLVKNFYVCFWKILLFQPS